MLPARYDDDDDDDDKISFKKWIWGHISSLILSMNERFLKLTLYRHLNSH